MASGGQAAIRGYLIQTLIALLDALNNENQWDSVTLEPNVEWEKIDILWEYPGSKKAVQVKSSQNSFVDRDISKWAKDLVKWKDADEYELVLVWTPKSPLITVDKDGEKVAVRSAPVMDEFSKSAAHRLSDFLRREGLPEGSPDSRTMLVGALTEKLAKLSTGGHKLRRSDLVKLLKEWMALIAAGVRSNEPFNFIPYLERLRDDFEKGPLKKHYISQYTLSEESYEIGEDKDLLERAMEWARGKGKMLWLLLGDYGTGKTAFIERFSYELAKQHLDSDPSMGIPIPIVIALKKTPLVIDGREMPKTFPLDKLLQEHLDRNPDLPRSAGDLLSLLAEGKVILMLDAFDEMRTIALGCEIEEQFQQLAAPTAQPTAHPGGNRMIITCRTHFFRNQEDIDNAVRGHCDPIIPRESRAGSFVQPSNASIYTLLSLEEEQIDEFLKQHLSTEQAQKTKTFIDETHDLASLARRPVLLKMIIAVRDVWERRKTNVKMTSAGLYNYFTKCWLESNLSNIAPEQCEELLERLAFELWGQPSNRIRYDKLRDVLENSLAELLDKLDRRLIDWELRTAAFLTRDNEGHYCFSHNSFLEFFYARHLRRSQRKGEDAFPVALKTAPVTSDCCLFLFDILESNKNYENLGKCLRAILEQPYQPKTSENALRLAYHLAEHLYRGSLQCKSLTDHMRSMVPAKAQLQGAQLREEKFKHAWLEDVDFSNAMLDGTNLEGAALHRAVLCGASLEGCRLIKADCRKTNFSRALIKGVDARGADFTGATFDEANLTAAVFVHSQCQGASFRWTNCHAARFAKAVLKDTTWFKAITNRMTCPDANSCLVTPSRPGKPTVFLHLGHRAGVQHAKFSRNCDSVLTASSDNTVRIWDAKTGTEIVRFDGHVSKVRSVVFSPNGKRVLSASEDSTARIWDAATGREIKIIRGHKRGLCSAVFSSDGKLVLTASDDSTARIWNAKTGREIKLFPCHGQRVRSAVFSPEEEYVLTANEDRTAQIWNTATGLEIRNIQGHKAGLCSAVFSSDGKHVLTASEDSTARISDAESDSVISNFVGHEGAVWSAVYSPDGKSVLTASDDRTARIWDAKNGSEILKFLGHVARVWSAVYSPDGKSVLTASDDRTARIWDAESGSEIMRFKGHSFWMWSAIFSIDGKRVLTASSFNTPRIWDAKTGCEIRNIQGHGGGVRSAVFSPEEERVLTASYDNTVRIWNTKTGSEIRSIEGHGKWVRSAVFSPNGEDVLTASYDNTARIWNAKTGHEILNIDKHKKEVWSAVFSSNGKRVLTASEDTTAKIWDVKSGNQDQCFIGHEAGVRSAVYSPEEKRVLTASSDNTARIWDVKTGREIKSIHGHGAGLWSAVFSPDGQYVLTASSDNTARIWDVRSGNQVSCFVGHGSGVCSAAFSPDGQYVLTASFDNTARIWNRRSRKCLRILVPVTNGWLTIDRHGRYQAGGWGLDALRYFDPNEQRALRTLWHAEDLPWMAENYNSDNDKQDLPK